MADPNRHVTGYPAPNPNSNGYVANPPPSGAANPYAAPDPPPSGTAYPYTAPAADAYYYSNNPYYQQNYPPDGYSARRAALLRRIFAFVIALVFIIGTVTLIIWLVLRPKLPEFRVDSSSVSNLTFSNNSLVSFTAEIRLTARNPNKKMTLSYDQIDAFFSYQSDRLSETNVSPFSQGTKTETPLTSNFAAAGRFVGNSVVSGINSEKDKKGNVEFNLRMVSRVEFAAKAWRTRRRFLKVFCGNLVVGFPKNGTSGTLTGGAKQCRVAI